MKNTNLYLMIMVCENLYIKSLLTTILIYNSNIPEWFLTDKNLPIEERTYICQEDKFISLALTTVTYTICFTVILNMIVFIVLTISLVTLCGVIANMLMLDVKTAKSMLIDAYSGTIKLIKSIYGFKKILKIKNNIK